MRGLWVVCVVAMSASWCGDARAQVEEPTGLTEAIGTVMEAESPFDGETETETWSEGSSVADAHAQFAPVLSPAALSLSEFGSYGSVLVYMGVDGWRYGGSAYVGSEWSPSADSLFIVRAFASDGFDDFRSHNVTTRSETIRASLLPGTHVRSGALDVKLFAGGDFLWRIPLRPAIEAPTLLFGARASADLWWEPAKDAMLSASFSATTIEWSVTARLASGWRTPFGWAGPELLAMHDVYNTQFRAGAHLSGFQVGLTEWSVAAGYAQDSFGRGGAYARLGISYRPLQ